MGENNWMKKAVFFTEKNNLPKALQYFILKNFAEKSVPVKLHMGEKKNPHCIKPEYAKYVIDELKKHEMKPFLFDTTVAYSGDRHTKEGYLNLAKTLGFSKKNIGCEVIVGDQGIDVTVEDRSFTVAKQIFNASHIIALTHGKGHIQTGFGGSIKNFGMGGVTRETKKKIHRSSRPVFNEKACTFCGVCAEMCPFDALDVKPNSWIHDKSACFGCGVCVESCPNNAIVHEDADLQYLIVLSAFACLKGKNVLYINELKRMAKSCDCDPNPGPIIVPDIGYVISDDPVAVDKASLDLIQKVKPNVFKKANGIDPYKQIKYGEEIGLGSPDYELIEL